MKVLLHTHTPRALHSQGAKLFYKKSEQEQERLKLSEVKHARLAMLAIIGELTQMMMFHKVNDCTC